MRLALLCQFTAQHVSDVNTSMFACGLRPRSLHPSSGACDYLVSYCVGCNVLTWGVLVLCSGIGCWWCGIRVVQPALRFHITNSQSRYITPTRLKWAHYSLHNNAPSSRKLLKMDVLTSETCWAVDRHNKASVIKLVYLYSNIKKLHGPICVRFTILECLQLSHVISTVIFQTYLSACFSIPLMSVLILFSMSLNTCIIF